MTSWPRLLGLASKLPQTQSHLVCKDQGYLLPVSYVEGILCHERKGSPGDLALIDSGS